MKLIQPDVLKKWEKAFRGGSDKRYPSIDLVRLEYWFFKNPEKGDLLEYGFGSGVNTIHLLECGYEIMGVDAAMGAKRLVEKKMSQYPEMQDRLTLKHLTLDTEKLPFEDNLFDYLVCISVLSLLGSKERVQYLLSEFVRVLKPGAKAILDINDTRSEFSENSEYIGDNVYLFRGGSGAEDPVACYCLPDEESFETIVEPYFNIVDVGYSGHRYFDRRIREFIICCEKDR